MLGRILQNLPTRGLRRPPAGIAHKKLSAPPTTKQHRANKGLWHKKRILFGNTVSWSKQRHTSSSPLTLPHSLPNPDEDVLGSLMFTTNPSSQISSTNMLKYK